MCSFASKSTFPCCGGGWDVKLTPGLTPRCSQGGWGWPPTAAWDWERRGKKWERDNCLFCHSFARAISRPAKAPLSFSQCKIHSFFATHHSTSIHIWYNFQFGRQKLNDSIFTHTHVTISVLGKETIYQRLSDLEDQKGTWSLDVWAWLKKAKQGDMLTMHL